MQVEYALTTSNRMDKDWSHVSKRLLDLSLEIFCLLTREAFAPVKSGDHVTIKVPPPHSLTPETHNTLRIVELINKITELLTGEVPIRCQDVTIYFSMEEWQYIEGHKDLYKDAMMEKQQTFSYFKTEEKNVPFNKTVLTRFMEIINLLTGENSTSESRRESKKSFPPVKSGDDATIMVHPPRSLSSERQDKQKILDVTNKMMGLLTGEVPIRCQDITVYFSMEEWQYIEGHKDLYKDAMMKNQPPLTSPACGPSIWNPSVTPIASSPDCKMETVNMQVCPVKHADTTDIHPESTYSSNSKQLHYRRQQGKRFQCPECGKCFRQKTEFAIHQGSHTDEKPFSHSGYREGLYSCPECGKSYGSKPDLVIHERTHADQKLMLCSECGKWFASESGFASHQRNQTDQKPFVCPQCVKCFVTTSQLAFHEKFSRDEKPYSCAECGKCFRHESHLDVHHRTHTGEKPYSCSECGKSYVQKSHLAEHQRSHTGEKPYFCSECGKSFRCNAHLVIHHRTHTGEKPFPCPECGKCFAQRAHLAEHKRSHNKGMIYTCPECGKRFLQKSYLAKHRKSHMRERAIFL